MSKLKITLSIVLVLLFLLLPYFSLYGYLIAFIHRATNQTDLLIIFSIVFYVSTFILPYWPIFILLAGSLFGFRLGVALSIIIPIAGNMSSYYLGQLLARAAFAQRLVHRVSRVQAIFVAFSTLQLFVIFISPIFPIRFFNYFFAVLGISKVRYFVAMMLSVVVYAIPTVMLGVLQGHLSLAKIGQNLSENPETTSIICLASLIAMMLFSLIYMAKICLEMIRKTEAA